MLVILIMILVILIMMLVILIIIILTHLYSSSSPSRWSPVLIPLQEQSGSTSGDRNLEIVCDPVRITSNPIGLNSKARVDYIRKRFQKAIHIHLAVETRLIRPAEGVSDEFWVGTAEEAC